MVRPAQLYLYLPENLSPFVFTVPSAFRKHSEFLKKAGTKDAPSAEDFACIFKEIYSERKFSILEPNELAAIVRLLRVVSLGPKDALGKIFVPTTRGILEPIQNTFFGDVSWISEDSLPMEFHLVHPSVDSDLCERLQIKKLSSVVREEMVGPKDFQEKEHDRMVSERLGDLLHSAEFSQVFAKKNKFDYI